MLLDQVERDTEETEQLVCNMLPEPAKMETGFEVGKYDLGVVSFNDSQLHFMSINIIKRLLHIAIQI